MPPHPGRPGAPTDGADTGATVPVPRVSAHRDSAPRPQPRVSAPRPEPRDRTRPAGRGPARAVRSAVMRRDAEGEHRSRLTGRAGVLVVVLAVLAVSYASSARAYLQQRAQLDDLREEITQREAAIDRLQTDKERWDDPAYVAQQARARFGYVMPGQTSYIVIGENGQPLDSTAELTDPATVGDTSPTAWWETAWGSVETAGHPPVDDGTPPATRIEEPATSDGSDG